MKMNQIVYVVSNVKTGAIYGVYNEQDDAILASLGEDFDFRGHNTAITPILVDARPSDENENCFDSPSLEEAVEDLIGWVEDEGDELYNWHPPIDEDEEDEDEDEEVTADDILREIAALLVAYLDEDEDDVD